MMSLTDDQLLYLTTTRDVTVYSINLMTHFWAIARSGVNDMQLVGCEGKSTRVIVQSEDSRYVQTSFLQNLKNRISV